MMGFFLLLCGLGMSALFSGSETGFYRATRARWVLDGQAGDQFSRILLWWANNPSVFVSVILIGNNVANYLVSLGIVILVGQFIVPNVESLEMIAAIALTPVIFLYGESLPKQLFLQAPNRLLRWVVPILVVFNLVLIPAVVVLWALGRVLEAMIGKSPERVQSRIARQELINMFREGHTAGLLEPVQMALAQNFFDMVDKTLDPLLIPLARVVNVKLGCKVEEAIEISRRHNIASLPVADRTGRLLGYVTLEELLLQPPQTVVKEMHEFAKIPANYSVAQSLIEMRSQDAELGLALDDHQQVRGMLSVHRLYEQLFTGALVRWRR